MTDDYIPDQDNAAVRTPDREITYEKWLERQKFTHETRQDLALKLVDDRLLGEFEQRFLKDCINHSQQLLWEKRAATKKRKKQLDKIELKIKYILLRDSGLSQNKAVAKLCEEYSRDNVVDESTIRARLGLKGGGKN